MVTWQRIQSKNGLIDDPLEEEEAAKNNMRDAVMNASFVDMNKTLDLVMKNMASSFSQLLKVTYLKLDTWQRIREQEWAYR